MPIIFFIFSNLELCFNYEYDKIEEKIYVS